MPEFTDQCHRKVRIKSSPNRIISLVPSQTALLHSLGLESKVLGITKFCVHPAGYLKSKVIVGGTKNLNLKMIRSLQPDLIIANKEENDQDQTLDLAREFPVWVSDVPTLDTALEMIEQVGLITSTEMAANQLVSQIKFEFDQYKKPTQTLNVAYIIWRSPFMSVGGDTFIHDMIRFGGWNNVFGHLQRYPQVDIETLQSASPDVVFLSSEPYPFGQKHIAEMQKICPNARILLVDGEMFSWYGSNLLKTPAYFKELQQILV